MIRMNVAVLMWFVRDLALLEKAAADLAQKGSITDDDEKALLPLLKGCEEADAFFYLPALRSRAERLAGVIKNRATYDELRLQLRVLWETLEDELKRRSIFFLDSGATVHFFAGENVLGPEVIRCFPDLLADADEAGKCMACGRYTAAVFHLMRVMESGVQSFAAKLEVSFVDQKNWQNILDEANKAIGKLPRTDPNKVQLAALATLLHAVKLAWRNEVMHPKATYTEDEAEAVLSSSKAFMARIALTCGQTLPPTSTPASGQAASAPPRKAGS